MIEMKWRFWGKCEYELIVIMTDDGRVLLSPWAGSQHPEKATVDVTLSQEFDWKLFAQKHIKGQVYGNRAKIDVWNQIDFQWDGFCNYCWGYKHKYQRKK